MRKNRDPGLLPPSVTGMSPDQRNPIETSAGWRGRYQALGR
jgi:hypothetical protein